MDDIKEAMRLLAKAQHILSSLSREKRGDIEALKDPKGGAKARALIRDCIARDDVGFRGGWVSSVRMDAALRNAKLDGAVPPNKRRDLLGQLGYSWHVGLTDGRVNNPLACDFGKKSRLFITEDHPSLSIARPAQVARTYEAAQYD